MSAQKAEKLSLSLFESIVSEYYEKNTKKKSLEKELNSMKTKIKQGLAEYGNEHVVTGRKNPCFYQSIQFDNLGLNAYARTDTKRKLNKELVYNLIEAKDIDLSEISEFVISEELLKAAVLKGRISENELESCYTEEKQTPKLYVEEIKEDEED